MVSAEDVDRAFRAIEEVPGEEDRRWNEFLRLLLQGGPLLALVDGETRGLIGYNLENSEGQSVLFAFTSLAEAELYGVRPEQVAPNTHITDYITVAKEHPEVSGVVVNQGSKGPFIPRQILLDMDRALTAPEGRILPKGTPLSVGEPADYPQVLVDDLAREAANHKAIKRMWLRQLSANGESSYLVVIDGRRDEEILRALGAVVRAHPELRQAVDVIMKPTESIGDGFAGPFYTKKRRGLFG